MNMDRTAENERALKAAKDNAFRELFLQKEQQHILRLTSKVLHASVTSNDDEWAIAFIAVSQALNTYDESKGDFWPYAAIVIRSRLNDWFRSQKRMSTELAVKPEVFAGEVSEEDPDFGIQCKVRDQLGVVIDYTLRDEIEALGQELSSYGFSFFDLAECSPKSKTTRTGCMEIIKAIFSPPPLVREINKNKCLPIKSILARVDISRKMLERHRKYIVAVSVILAGDYPALSEYVDDLKPKRNIEGEHGGNKRRQV